MVRDENSMRYGGKRKGKNPNTYDGWREDFVAQQSQEKQDRIMEEICDKVNSHHSKCTYIIV